MRSWVMLSALLGLSLGANAADGELAANRPVLAEFGFEAPLPAGAPPAASLVDDNGNQVLRVHLDQTGSAMVAFDLDPATLAGRTIQLQARIKAEDVDMPPQDWSGIKVMLHTNGPSGAQWSNPNEVFGTFDWTTYGIRITVPEDIEIARLQIGLEATRGTAWFDDVRLTLVRGPRQRPAEPVGLANIYRGYTDVDRLRGVMVSTAVTEQDLRDLKAKFNANLIRWQLHWGSVNYGDDDGRDMEAYDAFIADQTANLERLLPVCEELGIYVCLDLHTPPGGIQHGVGHYIFQEAHLQDKFIAVWEDLVNRFKGAPALWGYDLLNEAVEGLVSPDCLDWQELAEVTARRVRELDPDHAIIIEPASWGGIGGLADFEPVDVPGVVYSVHIYDPHSYTHQGVSGSTEVWSYPGVISNTQWDKERQRQNLQRARDWQNDYGVQLYIGEFSVIRWAEGGEQYLTDLIELIEEFGWDWSYHAYREWTGWSLEHDSNPDNNQRLEGTDPRGAAVLAAMARNQQPVFAR